MKFEQFRWYVSWRCHKGPFINSVTRDAAFFDADFPPHILVSRYTRGGSREHLSRRRICLKWLSEEPVQGKIGSLQDVPTRAIITPPKAVRVEISTSKSALSGGLFLTWTFRLGEVVVVAVRGGSRFLRGDFDWIIRVNITTIARIFFVRACGAPGTGICILLVWEATKNKHSWACAICAILFGVYKTLLPSTCMLFSMPSTGKTSFVRKYKFHKNVTLLLTNLPKTLFSCYETSTSLRGRS